MAKSIIANNEYGFVPAAFSQLYELPHTESSLSIGVELIQPIPGLDDEDDGDVVVSHQALVSTKAINQILIRCLRDNVGKGSD